tara:strand:+ start:179 stop:769 length:591 start_codon:yes stop_codon:yes gene_type:complete
MAFPAYTTADTADGTLDTSLLHQQISADPAIVTPFEGVTEQDVSFTLLFLSAPSLAEQAQCDALVAMHTNLPAVQDSLVGQIKHHRDGPRLSSDLHAEYPSDSGNLFGCGAASQDNWSKLATLDAQGAVTYPYTVTTFDERRDYSLTDSADRQAATLAVATVVETERGLAETYITNVLAATDAAGAKAAARPYLSL